MAAADAVGELPEPVQRLYSHRGDATLANIAAAVVSSLLVEYFFLESIMYRP